MLAPFLCFSSSLSPVLSVFSSHALCTDWTLMCMYMWPVMTGRHHTIRLIVSGSDSLQFWVTVAVSCCFHFTVQHWPDASSQPDLQKVPQHSHCPLQACWKLAQVTDNLCLMKGWAAFFQRLFWWWLWRETRNFPVSMQFYHIHSSAHRSHHTVTISVHLYGAFGTAAQ